MEKTIERDSKGRLKKGHPGLKPKGAVNKFTNLKQAFLDAFQDERMGGKEGLTEVFSKNDLRKMDFFKLISKMLPSNVDVGGGLTVNHKISMADLKKSMTDFKDKEKCKSQKKDRKK